MNLPKHFPKTLLIMMLAYGLASLLHFAHNAEFLADSAMNMTIGLEVTAAALLLLATLRRAWALP